MSKLPVTVTGAIEARKNLLPTLKRFREEGGDAEPVILGAHRKPEAVILPYETYQALLDQAESNGYEFLKQDPEYQADAKARRQARYGLATNRRAEGIKWVSDYFELPLHLAAAAMEAAENENIDGPLTFNEAKILVANDLARERKLTVEDVLTSSGINPAIAPVIRAHAERGKVLTAKEATELLERYPAQDEALGLAKQLITEPSIVEDGGMLSGTRGQSAADVYTLNDVPEVLTVQQAQEALDAAHKRGTGIGVAQRSLAFAYMQDEETRRQALRAYALTQGGGADDVSEVIDKLTKEALDGLRQRLRAELGIDGNEDILEATDSPVMPASGHVGESMDAWENEHGVLDDAKIGEAEEELDGMGHS